MEEKQPRKGGDGKINLDELEKYGDIEVQPELVKALAEVDPKTVETVKKSKSPDQNTGE